MAYPQVVPEDEYFPAGRIATRGRRFVAGSLTERHLRITIAYHLNRKTTTSHAGPYAIAAGVVPHSHKLAV